MQVLQILHDRERGGVQTLAAMIEEGLTPHGIDFRTEYLYPGPGLSAPAKLAATARMARTILRGGFDALIAYQSTASILVGAIGAIRGCRIRIVHQTSSITAVPTPLRLADKFVGSLGLYSINIANSVATRREFEHYPDPYRRSMILVEHGIDAPAPTMARAETRARFGLPQSERLLLNVGRLVEQKNQAVLVRALASIPGAHLAIAGGGPDEHELRALARELGLSQRLHLLGAVPQGDVADLVAASDLFVFPSTWETFGLAAVEAGMLGLPIVATDLPVLREVLATDSRRMTFFVRSDHVAGWSAAIDRALKHPPSPEAKASFASTLAKRYSRERMIARYLEILQPNAPGLAGYALHRPLNQPLG